MSKMKNSNVTRARWAAFGAAVAVVAGAGGLTFVSAADADGSAFVPISPCRIGDTRPAPNAVGPNEGQIGPDAEYTYSGQGTSGDCVLPDDAVALSVNLTSAGATERSFFTAYPTGETRPLAAHLVPGAGTPITENGVQIALSDDGEFTVYNNAGSSHVIIDVLGVFVPSSGEAGPAGPVGEAGPAGPAGPEKELFSPDNDGDGFGNINVNAGQLKLAATAPSGFGPVGDCNDFNDAVNPDATEVLDSGQDDNCDQSILQTLYTDGDGDFYGTGAGTATLWSFNDGLPAGLAPSSGDCNDGDSSINPGAFDIPNDGIDQDCFGGDEVITDGDGDLELSGLDYFFGTGQCSDGVDNDGDGQADFGGDGECDSSSDPFEGDCDDGDPAVNSAAMETPSDGTDQNCNGDDDT